MGRDGEPIGEVLGVLADLFGEGQEEGAQVFLAVAPGLRAADPDIEQVLELGEERFGEWAPDLRGPLSNGVRPPAGSSRLPPDEPVASGGQGVPFLTSHVPEQY
jgi:hypothetical protein